MVQYLSILSILLKGSRMGFTVNDYPNSDGDTAALDFFDDLSERYFKSKSFVWSINFRNWETNRVIQRELYMNIGLAFVAVFIVTLLLVADLLTCVFVCTTVIFTLVSIIVWLHCSFL